MLYETFRFNEMDVTLDDIHLVFKFVFPNFINMNESKSYIPLEDIVHRTQDGLAKFGKEKTSR